MKFKLYCMKKLLPIIVIVLVLGVASFLSWHYFGNRPTASEPTPIELKKGLVLDNVKENDTVGSPFKITGYTNGEGWGGFEGQVGSVRLYDNNNNILDIKPLTATTEWMTSTVYFEANLEYITTAREGRIVFKNENASSEPSRDKEVSFKVKLVPTNDVINVQAYFSNSKLDPEITCEKVFAVNRVLPKTVAVARAALQELLKGPTAAEQFDGYVTNINEGVQINSLVIENNGVAKVDFSDEMQKEVGGACRVTAIRAQIVETLNQFPTVKSVVISVNGNSEDILQP